jgi:Ras-related protein Rab-1A
VEKALLFLDRDELPPHWDRDLLFGMDESSGNSDSDGGFDSDVSKVLEITDRIVVWYSVRWSQNFLFPSFQKL